mgnify:CR=1 FL=1
MNVKEVRDALLYQMELYFNGKMTKEEYAIMAESFYSQYAYLIEHTQFYDIFSAAIPDCCIINVDEPGNEDKKELDFHRIVKETYEQLKML